MRAGTKEAEDRKPGKRCRLGSQILSTLPTLTLEKSHLSPKLCCLVFKTEIIELPFQDICADKMGPQI